MMNKKGFGPVTIIFWAVTFAIIWAMTLAPIISYWGNQVVVNGQLTGIEAFGYQNINLIIGVVFFCFVGAFALLGGGD